MTSCNICKKYTGRVVEHGLSGCSLALSTSCRRCHHRGHLTSDCTGGFPQWERPSSLEELIPADVRRRFGIITHTAIAWTAPRGAEGTETELGAINEVNIPYTYTAYSEFIKRHKIKVEGKVTKGSLTECVKSVKNWCVTHGYRLVQADDIRQETLVV